MPEGLPLTTPPRFSVVDDVFQEVVRLDARPYAYDCPFEFEPPGLPPEHPSNRSSSRPSPVLPPPRPLPQGHVATITRTDPFTDVPIDASANAIPPGQIESSILIRWGNN